MPQEGRFPSLKLPPGQLDGALWELQGDEDVGIQPSAQPVGWGSSRITSAKASTTELSLMLSTNVMLSSSGSSHISCSPIPNCICPWGSCVLLDLTTLPSSSFLSAYHTRVEL